MLTADDAVGLAPAGPLPRPLPAPETGTRRSRRPGPTVVLGGAVTAVALALNTWALSLNGSGNDYYTAAARSMATSWSNWFFAAFDPGGFISVDKPPVPLWITSLSVRIFGYSSWSVLLPSAMAGAAAVALLFTILRRRFGLVAATVAGLVLAVSPVSVATNRLNLPEPWMMLFLLAAVWAVERAPSAARRWPWLVGAGVFVGLAFNTKMLAACIPLPALGLAVLLQAPTWRRRLADAASFAGASIAVALSWLVIVDLVPASARPYVGGSADDTVLDLVLGYNGLGRVEGTGAGGFGGGRFPGGGGGIGGAGGAGRVGGMTGAGGIMGGSPGSLRLLSEALGGQIAWLLPLALFGAIAAGWAHRRHRERRASVVLWAGWALLYGWVFSIAQGTFHAYYTAAMAPAVAALVGVGVASVVVLGARDRRWWPAAGVAVVTTLALQLRLIGRFPSFYGWVEVPVVIAVVGGLAATAWHLRSGPIGRRALIAGAVTLGGLLLAPTAWAVSETANPVLNATLPQAGPRSGAAGTSFGSASWNGDPALAAFLEEVHTGETWDLVVANAQQASGLIADEGVPVLAIGGFMGTDDSTDVTEVAKLVADGQVRLFLVSGSGRSGGPGGGPGGTSSGAASTIMDAVASACRPVGAALDGIAVPTVDGTLYDCAGAALA